MDAGHGTGLERYAKNILVTNGGEQTGWNRISKDIKKIAGKRGYDPVVFNKNG